jgi:hypothetical protein
MFRAFIRPCLNLYAGLSHSCRIGKSISFGQGQRWQIFNRDLQQATGINWLSNVTRHSFVSYHLARFQNVGKTALEAGHSEAMLFRHYREIVTPESAEVYFSIFPE